VVPALEPLRVERMGEAQFKRTGEGQRPEPQFGNRPCKLIKDGHRILYANTLE